MTQTDRGHRGKHICLSLLVQNATTKLKKIRIVRDNTITFNTVFFIQYHDKKTQIYNKIVSLTKSFHAWPALGLSVECC